MPRRKPRCSTALDALTIAPEQFTPETADLSRPALDLLAPWNAKNDDALREVVARLWEMAVQLEDGNVSRAEQALRAGARGVAPGARTRRERGRNQEADGTIARGNGQIPAGPCRRNAQESAAALTSARPQYAHASPSRISRACSIGSNSWRVPAPRTPRGSCSISSSRCWKTCRWRGRAQQGGDDGDDDMMSALDELGDMIRKQQQLRDKTFRQGQDMRRDRQRASTSGSRATGRWAICARISKACGIGSRSCWTNSATRARHSRARKARERGGPAR